MIAPHAGTVNGRDDEARGQGEAANRAERTNRCNEIVGGLFTCGYIMPCEHHKRQRALRQRASRAAGSSRNEPRSYSPGPPILETFGTRLRRLREAKGITVATLAVASGTTRKTVALLESGDLEAPAFLLGLRLAHHLGVSPQYLASGATGYADLVASVEARLRELERLIPGAADRTDADRVSVFGVASLTYDDEDRAIAVRDAIQLYPKHLRAVTHALGIKAVIFPAIELFGQQSRYLRRRGRKVDALDQPPAGVFVLPERTLYLRSSSPKTVAHEYAHSLDCALGDGRFFSHLHPAIRDAFSQATAAGAFVTPYAGTTLEEYFAEGVRSMVEANDPRSSWPPVSRERSQKKDPALSALLEPIFDPARFPHSIATERRCSTRAQLQGNQ